MNRDDASTSARKWSAFLSLVLALVFALVLASSRFTRGLCSCLCLRLCLCLRRACKPAFRGRHNLNTLWRQHCWRDHVSQTLIRFATCATFVADSDFVSWTQNMFLKIFLLQPHQKYHITQYEELGFSSLTQMKDDDTTKFSHYLTYTFLLKGWENVIMTVSPSGQWSSSTNAICSK